MRFSLVWFWFMTVYAGFTGCGRINPPVDDQEPFVRLRRDQSFNSRILNRTVKYVVLLPADYEHSTVLYPVVYLLHGMGDDETAWCDGGGFAWYADYCISETGPAIYIMPEGFNSYWVNKYNGLFPYMDMLVTEMVPLVDSLFHTSQNARHRAVMGYSMGGYGALVLPAKNPEVFKTGVALSISFRTDQQYMDEPQSVFDYQWGSVFGGIGASGTSRLTDYYTNYSPFHFFRNPDDPALSGQNYYLDCGDDEENLSEPNDALHVLLNDLNISHEYRVANGAHNWDYWHRALPEAMKYIGHAFHGISYPDGPAPVESGPAVPADRIVDERLEGFETGFRVVLPPNYDTDTAHYPVIVVLHHRDSLAWEEESGRLLALLNTLMTNKALTASLAVEIPSDREMITADYLRQVLARVSTVYRKKTHGKYALMLGNGSGGRLAYDLLPQCDSLFNACMLFDADLPDDATAGPAGLSYYLDICDKGKNYDGYHSLFMDLRKNKISHEYRVRQGTVTHDSFLTGFDEAVVYMRTHLKY